MTVACLVVPDVVEATVKLRPAKAAARDAAKGITDPLL
jgi:hypothetical protein